MYRRQHPLNILARTSRFFILLILPVLRGLFFSGGDLYVWISGAWIDLLVVGTVIFLGYIGWYFDLYRFTDRGIYLYTGIFAIKKEFIPFDAISSISIESPWYFRPFHAARIHADTATGAFRHFDFSVTMHRTDAHRILKAAGKQKDGPKTKRGSRTYRSNLFFVSVLSLITSNSFTGVVFAATLLTEGGKIFGVEFEQQLVDNITKISQIVVFGVPPFTILISLLVIVGWMIAFGMNIIRYAKFSLSRQKNTLLIQTGVWINRRIYFLDARLLNLVEIRQTLFTKIFGFYSVYLDCIGYGKSKNEKNVFIPAASRGASLRVLTTLLPEIPFVKQTLRPKRSEFRFFITIPVSLIVGTFIVVLVTCRLFPSFSILIGFFGIMLEILWGAYLTMRIFAYYHTGIGVRNGIFTVQYTHGFLFSRISFPVQKLSKVHFRQTPFQKRTGCCTITFYTFGERRQRHVVPNVNLERAKELLEPTIGRKEVFLFERT